MKRFTLLNFPAVAVAVYIVACVVVLAVYARHKHYKPAAPTENVMIPPVERSKDWYRGDEAVWAQWDVNEHNVATNVFIGIDYPGTVQIGTNYFTVKALVRALK